MEQTFMIGQNILQKFEQQMKPSPILPKMSLNINWDTLFPEEKAVFADMFGRKDLSQQETQIQHDPSQIVKAKEGIQKTDMKAQADMQKNQQDPQIARQEMAIEQQKHAQEMQQQQDKHNMGMQAKQQAHNQKMQQNQDTQNMALLSKAIQTSKMLHEPNPSKAGQ